MTALIELKQVTYTYPTAVKPALRDISLTVERGSWVLLQGQTGSGKSTLLKCLTGACPEFYGGTISGDVWMVGDPLTDLTQAQRVGLMGYVGQDPEATAVYNTVQREVAFSLENLGVPPEEMLWRVAEALEMVGLTPFAEARVDTLSGGERQRLAIASALVHQPQLLVLDEPTSQLDPVASDDLFDCLRRLQHSYGMTIVMSEHRLDAAYERVDEVVVLQDGVVRLQATPHNAAAWLRQHDLYQTPALARLLPDHPPALSVREVKALLHQTTLGDDAASTKASDGAQARDASHGTSPQDAPSPAPSEAGASGGASPHGQSPTHTPSGAIALQGVTATYGGQHKPALQQCDVRLAVGAVTAVVGPNGSGKSTLLRLLAGLQKPVRGKIQGRPAALGYLPQKPSDLFSQLTVREEIGYGLRLRGMAPAEVAQRVREALNRFQLDPLAERAPRDVSGGEQMRVAVASLWVSRPQLLLLDEPTRGLDAAQKETLADLLAALETEGVTVVLVTHDMEFVAETCAHMVFLSGGRVVLQGAPADVFSRALVFAPAVARAFRGVVPDIHSLADAVRAGWAR